MRTKALYPEKRKERAEQELTDEMLAAQAEQRGISLDEMRDQIKDNPVWAARLDMVGSLERRRKFRSLYSKVQRFLKNHPEFLAQHLRAAVAGCFDAVGQLVAQRGTESRGLSQYLERPLTLLDKGLAIARDLSEAEDVIATKKSKDKVLTLYETLVMRLPRAEAEKNREERQKIVAALEKLRPQAKRRMRALEPDYIASMSHRLRILRLRQEATEALEEILRSLSENIRSSIEELTDAVKDPELTDEVLADLSAIPLAIDYSLPSEQGEPTMTVDGLRREVRKDEERLNETVKRVEECKVMILEMKEIENAIIETLFPEFEISRIEWDVPVERKEAKIRGLVPGVVPRGSSSRMVRGKRREQE